MKRGKEIISLSNKLVKNLNTFCKKIQVVGSIRRREKNPVDIDIVLIPKNKIDLENFMKEKIKAKFIQGGEHESTWKLHGIKIELYYATENSFGASLLAYSSEVGAGIGLRKIAKSRGFKLNNYGLFKGKKKIAGKTEREIYYALGRKYKQPWNR
jgi:DNA polymerase (family 10)